MSIPFPSALRSPGRLLFETRSSVFVHTSPYTSASQRVAMAGADVWAFTATWLGLRGRELDLMEGFLSQLQGRSGTFTLSPWHRRAPSGTATGPGATVGTTAQFATSVVVSGVGSGRTLLTGDLLQLGTQVHRVVTDATADGSGQITVSVRPALRLAQTAGAVVTLSSPTAIWRLTEDAQGIERTAGGFADVTLSAIEAL
jgi:hypothetical protein